MNIIIKIKLLCIILSLPVLFFGGCDSSDVQKEDISPQLTGTCWKLVAFAEEDGVLKVPNSTPDKIDQTLWFCTDSTLVGHADSTFLRGGSYRTEASDKGFPRITFSIWGGTSASDKFVIENALEKAYAFLLTEEELKIIYGKNAYMLFKRRADKQPFPSELMGMNWKFTGFVNVKTGEIDPPNLASHTLYYVLWFQKNNRFIGYSGANYKEGSYTIDSAVSTIQLVVSFTTKVGEHPYGRRFEDALTGTYKYTLSEEGFRIWENDDCYLQFIPYY